MIKPEELMRLAIQKAREALDRGQYPFGCAIAFGDETFAEHNRIRELGDVTAHAEITALRHASKVLGQIHIPGALVAATSEPCLMCAGALHWAQVETVWFGTTVQDVMSISSRELPVSVADLLGSAGSSVQIVPGFMRSECLLLLEEWRRLAERTRSSLRD